MKNLFIISLIVLLPCVVSGQTNNIPLNQDTAYTKLIYKADSCFKGKEYYKAINYYYKAEEKRPYEMYPKDRIAWLNEQIKYYVQDSVYKISIKDADYCFTKKDYFGARNYYQQALNAKPQEKYPADRIKELDGLIKELSASKVVSDTSSLKPDTLFFNLKFIQDPEGSKRISGVWADVYKDGVFLFKTDTSSAKGKINFYLIVNNSDYKIIVSKAGYVSKRFDVSAKYVSKEIYRSSFYSLDIFLFKQAPGLDSCVLNCKPVAKMYYNSLEGKFYWDTDYYNQVHKEIKQDKLLYEFYKGFEETLQLEY